MAPHCETWLRASGTSTSSRHRSFTATLKPNNVLFDQDTGKLRITDFGIGGVMSKAALAQENRGGTSAGVRLGELSRGSHTPLYSSPQQARCRRP